MLSMHVDRVSIETVAFPDDTLPFPVTFSCDDTYADRAHYQGCFALGYVGYAAGYIGASSLATMLLALAGL